MIEISPPERINRTRALPIGIVIRMTTSTISPKAISPKAVSPKAAKATTDAIEGKSVETIVAAFKAAYSAELLAVGQLADIQATIATNRVYMVRSLVQLAKVPAFKYRGGLNQSKAAESLGVPRTSLANHMKAIAVFTDKGIEVAASKPEKWEFDAVDAAWEDAAKASKTSKAKDSNKDSNKDSEGEESTTAPANNMDKVTSAHEDATAMAEAMARMVNTYAGTWSAKELNDLILSLQTTVDFLEDIATA